MNRFGLSRFSCQGLFSRREVFMRKPLQTQLQAVLPHRPIKHGETNNNIAHPPGAQRPGLIINPSTDMAWRPYANLIDGELNNSTPGKVTGWMRFFRRGMTPLRVTFRAELQATSPPACRLASGPRNSPRDSLRKMRSSGTRLGFQQPSGKSAGRCRPSSTADTSNRATDTLPMWTIPTSSGTRKRTVGWYWSWTLYKWRSSIRKDNHEARVPKRASPAERRSSHV